MKRTTRRQTLAEILKPIHDEVEASGISEKALARAVDQAVVGARTNEQQMPSLCACVWLAESLDVL